MTVSHHVAHKSQPSSLLLLLLSLPAAASFIASRHLHAFTGTARARTREAHREFSMTTSIEILKIDRLLTRIEHNSDSCSSCSRVLIYNHGFPDASVTPFALERYTAEGPSNVPENGYFASKLPRKVCEGLLKTLPGTAFVAFNTLGIPGSTNAQPEKVDEAPPEFFDKTLVQDMRDIQQVAAFLREHRFPEASMFICGMSTGAFLSVAFAHRKDLHPSGGIQGVWALACVDDIPSSVSLDFDPEQLSQASADGFCMSKFFPYGAENNPQSWKLGKAYIESYVTFPSMAEVAESLEVPLLLLHGEDDKHVPIEHTEHLESIFASRLDGQGPEVKVVRIPKGNHFLSNNTAMKKAISAISDFVAAYSSK